MVQKLFRATMLHGFMPTIRAFVRITCGGAAAIVVAFIAALAFPESMFTQNILQIAQAVAGYLSA
jgi:hypothetical protein